MSKTNSQVQQRTMTQLQNEIARLNQQRVEDERLYKQQLEKQEASFNKALNLQIQDCDRLKKELVSQKAEFDKQQKELTDKSVEKIN